MVFTTASVSAYNETHPYIKAEEGKCMVHNLPYGNVHTISAPYDEELLNDQWVCG